VIKVVNEDRAIISTHVPEEQTSMWPFSRKQKDIGNLPPIIDPSHTWGVAQGKCGRSPLIVRFSNSAKEWCSHPDLPIKLGFAIPLNSPTEGGLPDPAENEELDHEIEDIIRGEVAARTKGLHALVLTTGTMKEFVFYIPREVDIKTLHEAIQAAVVTHQVQCMAVNEPNWDSYRAFNPD
jgi:hypothetical protein